MAPEEDRQKIEDKLASAEPGFLVVLKRVILQTIDMFWMDHLDMMDYMRSSVNLRAYGQRDPLVEYKKEGLRLFKEMEDSVQIEILKLVPQIQPAKGMVIEPEPVLVEGRPSEGSNTASSSQGGVEQKKLGRNEPCWCGSGKKYKNCHGR